jgi:MFS family permease
MLSSEDHPGFYTAFGISLAVVIFPLISGIQFQPLGLEPEQSTLLLIAGLSGLLTGLLYVGSPDRYVEHRLKKSAKYHEGKCDPELLSNIAEVDHLVTSWYKPSWTSSEKMCLSMVDETTDSPSIQRAIWKLKRRAGIGLLFVFWSLSLGSFATGLEIVSVIGLGFGLVVFGITIYRGESRELVGRIRKLAFVSYSNDALQNWQPLSTMRSDDPNIERMSRLRSAASDLGGSDQGFPILKTHFEQLGLDRFRSIRLLCKEVVILSTIESGSRTSLMYSRQLMN